MAIDLVMQNLLFKSGDRDYMHSNTIQEEEADDRFRKLDYVFARAAQKPILDIFKEICKTFDFRLPVFQQQQPLSNTKKTVRMSLTIKKMGVPVVGIGKTIDKAKRSPAVKMLMEIRKSARNGESLNEVKTPELFNCGEWMKKYPSVKAIILHEETPTEDSRQEHSRWILAN
ncbi:hypothetical protein DAPPUDRAFT_116799 [Daphnia pulex]|uniref:Uncharacterized protein n=1 Tax=Daphnia pulex TaxID=6669 RepID=E9HQJ5_DAPPU|nr:hypothetical protein DAPPUDRAFT_116799 [Daphnia pulex]|eukprot:EFX65977.1 hypothetical protein DAPPUDRAFT_116799 [Daphnia pulex]